MIEKELKERRLPPYKSREEMLEILMSEEYGYIPQKPDSVFFKEKSPPAGDLGGE